jgi:Uncharacterized protein conserved in bacteria
MAGIDYDIVKKVGTVSQSSRGWEKQLNIISWNGRAPKFDLRDWSPDGKKMGKGITLSREELQSLRRLLEHMEELND